MQQATRFAQNLMRIKLPANCLMRSSIASGAPTQLSLPASRKQRLNALHLRAILLLAFGHIVSAAQVLADRIEDVREAPAASRLVCGPDRNSSDPLVTPTARPLRLVGFGGGWIVHLRERAIGRARSASSVRLMLRKVTARGSRHRNAHRTRQRARQRHLSAMPFRTSSSASLIRAETCSLHARFGKQFVCMA